MSFHLLTGQILCHKKKKSFKNFEGKLSILSVTRQRCFFLCEEFLNVVTIWFKCLCCCIYVILESFR